MIALITTMIATLAMALTTAMRVSSDLASATTTSSTKTRIGASIKTAVIIPTGTDVTLTEDTDDCYTAEVDELGEPVLQACGAAELDEFGEAIWKYKVLCYEDICLWIVQNPKSRGRDLFAIEVSLRHYKGVDNKPKPYATPPCVLNPANSSFPAQLSCFGKILSLFFARSLTF